MSSFLARILPSSCSMARNLPRITPHRLSPRTSRYLTSGSASPSQQPQLGVAAAVEYSRSSLHTPRSTLFSQEFSLHDRVAVVSGGNRGIGLEMAMALLEAGARAVYCLDLPARPGEQWTSVRQYIAKMDLGGGNLGGRLEYLSLDVRSQREVASALEKIGDKEGRMDVCVAAAGVLKSDISCLEYPEAEFKEVLDVNVNGALYTAQAAGRQMVRFGNPGSIIIVASMSGSLTNKDQAWVSYNTSKSAVIQMARSMACELGVKNIRVNSLSPGYIYTNLTSAYLDKQPGLLENFSNQNPLGRIARPDEMRGVVTWLASDASSYCTGSDILVTGGHHSW